LSNSFFQFKSFIIQNPQKGLKVTTDACLLGAVANHSNPNTIIDIGCGSAVIALMLAQKYKNAEITAIDIDGDVIDNARFNICQSNFQNDFNVIQDDFLAFQFSKDFDLLICNPPYFKNYLQNPNSDNFAAIHIQTMDFNHLISKSKSLMNHQSLFWVILPPYEMFLFRSIAKQTNLFEKSITSIFNKPEKHFREIVCFSLQYNDFIDNNTLLMFNEHDTMTDDFKKLMHPFYLDK
jgi:tRNA1Val (adenine37-N6)-methyltransferase